MAHPTHPVLRQLLQLDTSSPDFHRKLTSVLYGQVYRKYLQSLGANDMVWLVNYLDKAFDGLDPSDFNSRTHLQGLINICGASAILPTSFTISPYHLNIDSDPFTSEDFGDVFRGTLNNSLVTIKRVRGCGLGDDRTPPGILCREVVMWKRLKHPNIVPLLGITTAPLQLVSTWMPGGNLRQYIKSHPDVDRLEFVADIARGLCYLHSCDVIHGNIKCSSVLVDESGRARIIGFGLAIVIRNVGFMRNTFYGDGVTPRWIAPEVLREGAYTKAADIFSFAMLMIEVFTDSVLFGGSGIMVVVDIMQGRRPPRPEHPAVTSQLWKLIQRCWNQAPHLRPQAEEVLKWLLESNPPAWRRLIAPDLTAKERIALLTEIFSDRDEAKAFEYLSKEDSQTFIDVTYQILNRLPQQAHKRCLRYFFRVCNSKILLPKSLQIPLCYDPLKTPDCHGGFSDVWKGTHNGQVVAAKVARVSMESDFEQIRRRFCREVIIWKALDHPNVLPLIGVTMTENKFIMVSSWMGNGDIKRFLAEHPNADRMELLRDTTKGLIYMHELGVIHGDLKGENIVIDNYGHARLTDFTLINLAPDQSTFIFSCMGGGTVHFMSPELLDPPSFGFDRRRVTVESDCYALGMVVYETLSGQVAFDEVGPFVALAKVLEGERPGRPVGREGELFTDRIWQVVERCWKHVPAERASAKDVLRALGGIPAPPPPPSYFPQISDVDADEDSDEAMGDSGS